MNMHFRFYLDMGLDRIKGPCRWGIMTVWFCLSANASYFPGVGVYIDRCITRTKNVVAQTKKRELEYNVIVKTLPYENYTNTVLEGYRSI